MTLIQRFSVLILSFVLMLSGCVMLSDGPDLPQPNDARYDDAGIKTSIASSLLKEDPVKANSVNVHCFNGHVFLIGEADVAFRAEALKTAEATEEVVHVTTHWFASGTGSPTEDAAIEQTIEERVRLDQDSSRRLGLDVWGGNVVLTGTVDSQTAVSSLVSSVKSVPGVVAVTCYITVD